jgi:hypothetical protein
MTTEGCYVDIIDPEISTIVIETSVSCNLNNIEVERYETYNLEVVNTDILLLNNIPDVPVDKITGLTQYIIDNLDIDKNGTYLSLKILQNGGYIFFGGGFNLDDYLDYYEFDGGTP